ncbi:MAG: hypothetical protein KatS3mg002_0132 [Candidatus Woesearchaeota archaeon]|nr:MAG: hypothetical protein KatS3mg002_0132 [Candidatus Woesearchaeota archaeon]
MTLEQKLTDLEIKRILVVDDRIENVLAAKQAFSKYSLASIDYAASASEAVTMMETAFKEGKKYDLVISDMEMETKTSGLDVVKQAIVQLSYATIATGINYDRSKHEAHGATTTILPTGSSIKGKKE